MGIVQDDLTHEDLDVNLTISAVAPGESRPPGDIISISVSEELLYNASELTELGQWLITQGEYIARHYDHQGKRKS